MFARKVAPLVIVAAMIVGTLCLIDGVVSAPTSKGCFEFVAGMVLLALAWLLHSRLHK